jgi:hypothetical protein
MIDWTQHEALVKELAARRCIVFLGAGASAGSVSLDGKTSPPTWKQLLEKMMAKSSLESADKAYVIDLISKDKYLDAAEIIVQGMNKADYEATLLSVFESPKFQPSKIHEAIFKIEPKVVITTNFDSIYDLYCRHGRSAAGYNVYKHTDDHLASGLKSPMRCIVKAHGCITDPKNVVLTRSQFFNAKRLAPGFFRLLDSLFLTNTLLFVGYSMSDPDIQLTLENSNIAAPDSHPHYILAEAGTHPVLRKSMEQAYNLRFLEYPEKNYAEQEAALNSLADAVIEMRETNPNL